MSSRWQQILSQDCQGPTGRKWSCFLLNKVPVLTRVSAAKWRPGRNHIPAGAEIIYKEAISNLGHQSTAEQEFKRISLFTLLKIYLELRWRVAQSDSLPRVCKALGLFLVQVLSKSRRVRLLCYLMNARPDWATRDPVSKSGWGESTLHKTISASSTSK